MTPTKPRPVVRVVYEFYPKVWPSIDPHEREEIEECCRCLDGSSKDYRRPRVVSVRRVRARRA